MREYRCLMVAPRQQVYINICGSMGPTGRKAQGPPQHGLLRQPVIDPMSTRAERSPKKIPHIGSVETAALSYWLMESL